MDILNLAGSPKLPIVRQSEASECGLACMAMIATYHGFQVDLAALRRRFSTSMRGMSLKAMMGTAHSIGLEPRAIEVTMQAISKVSLPAIVHWDFNHYVVLKEVTPHRAIVHDPAQGVREYSLKEFAEHFTSVALELNPGSSFEKKTESVKLKISDLWGRIVGIKRNIIQLLALSIVLQLFTLASPLYLQIVIDEVVTKSDFDFLAVLAFAFGAFAIISCITTVLRDYTVLYFGSNLSFQMTNNLFRHLIHLPLEYFEKRHIGDVVSRFGSMEPVRKMLTEGIVATVIDGIMAITTLLFMFVYSPTLAFVSLAALLLYMTLRFVFYRQLRARQEELVIASAKEETVFLETVRGMSTLKLFNAENDRQSLWQTNFAERINTSAGLERLNIWFQSFNQGLFGLENVVLIYIAALLIMDTDFTVGMIFAFMAYKRNFIGTAVALVERTIEYKMLDLHLERIADIAHTETEKESDKTVVNYEEQTNLLGHLRLDNVSYRYSSDSALVLNSASVDINAGQSVAIVGLSGCGKTTLLKIMTGLFEQESGELFIDEHPLSQYGKTNYRQQVAVVMQDDHLFAGTLADNIAFFDNASELSEIREAARLAQIDEEIMVMPLKYETRVGDMGTTLSGGQSQRVMIARALYRKPKILFLDEGTAHLDTSTEAAVNKALANLNITRIVVAHRPQTIASADRVIEVRNGRLYELN